MHEKTEEWLGLLRPPFLDLNSLFSGLGKIVIDGDSLVHWLLCKLPKGLYQPGLAFKLTNQFLESLNRINSEEICVVFFEKLRSLYPQPAANEALLLRSALKAWLCNLEGSAGVVVNEFADWWTAQGLKSWMEFLAGQRISFVLAGDGEFARAVWGEDAAMEYSVLFLRTLASGGFHTACLNSAFSVTEAQARAFIIVPTYDQQGWEVRDLPMAKFEGCSTLASIEAQFSLGPLFANLPEAGPIDLSLVPSDVLELHSRVLESVDPDSREIYESFDSSAFLKALCPVDCSAPADQSHTSTPVVVIENPSILCRFIERSLDQSDSSATIESISYEDALKTQIVSIPKNDPQFLTPYSHNYKDCLLDREDEAAEAAEAQKLLDDPRAAARARKNAQRHAKFLIKYTESLEGSKGLHHIIVPCDKNATSSSDKKPSISAKAQKIIDQNKQKQQALQLEKDSANIDAIIQYLSQLKTTPEQIAYLDSVNLKIFSSTLTYRVHVAKLDLLISSWKENIYDYENKIIPHPCWEKLTAIVYFCIQFIKDHGEIAPVPILISKPINTLAALGFGDLAISTSHTFITSKPAVLEACLQAVGQVKVIKRLSNPCSSSVRFQLKYGGPFFPRTLFSKPDPRVLFSPDQWQVELLDIVDKDESAFICAPTSSGKTFISYYAMERVLRADDEGIVVFVAPTKPLITQVQAEIFARFQSKVYSASASNMVLCGVYSRDFCENPFNCQVLVTVPQILQLLLESPELHAWTKRIRYVILDEIHMINEEEFGPCWERIIQSLSCPLLAMSATVENREAFFNWIKSVQALKGIPCHLIQHFERWSDLKKYYYKAPPGQSELKSVNAGASEDSIVDIHPLATITWEDVARKGISEDLLFLPEDSLELYEVLNSADVKSNCGVDSHNADMKSNCGVDSHNADMNSNPTLTKLTSIQSLDPDTFFEKGKLLTKKDARVYEGALKEFLVSSIQQGSLPKDQFTRVKSTLCAPYQQATLAAQSDLTHEAFLKKNFCQLAVDLKAGGKLPALFFHVERREFCNELALELLSTLEEAERKKALVSKFDRLKASTAEKGLKALKKTRDTAKVTKDSWIDDSIQSEELQDTLTDSSEVDPDFSFTEPRFKIARKEMDEVLAGLKRKMTPATLPLLEALRRGIGVHHTGLPKKYLQQVEFLFRKRHLQIVISSQTLALGINMPCKTSVFLGDSLSVNAVQFRQMSGRAGRRGFDDIGHVIFFGTPPSKISKLLASRLPRIQGNGASAISHSDLLVAAFPSPDMQHLRGVLKNIEAIVRFPLMHNGSSLSDINIRLKIDQLMRFCILNPDGHPALLARIAVTCKEFDPLNWTLVQIVATGCLDWIIDNYLPQGLDIVCEEIIKLFATFIQVLPLAPMQALAFQSLKDKNSDSLRSRHQSLVILPPLHATLRQRVALVRAIMPGLAGVNTAESGLKNAYILDYYRHTHVKTIEWMNGVGEGQLWHALDSFARALKFVQKWMRAAEAQGLEQGSLKIFEEVVGRFDVRFKEMYA